MTRPQIIRADTLDLQDKTSPAAQDHSRQPTHPAPLGVGPAAPHQEASLRHVDEERSEEEAQLQNGYVNDLRDDPGSDDERTVMNQANGDKSRQQDETAVRLNGGMTGDGDDEDMHDADADEDLEDDDDDDMMDKISSSPSIDDGGYSLPCYPASWPERSSSLTPNSSPAQSPMASDSTCIDSSSPFTTTPIHFPLAAAAAQGPLEVLAGGPRPISKSPSPSSPIPFSFKTSQKQSADHHRGEYLQPRTTNRLAQEPDLSPRTSQLSKVEARLQCLRQDSQVSLISDLDEEDAKVMLRPMRSPRHDTVEDPFLEIGQTQDPISRVGNDDDGDDDDDDDEGFWTTDSDADSWDEHVDQDDDTNDLSFSDDSRFIDSGWGGECLRETEDIDFEFVYALHTFVATVEGQANATKGDTMVLLDDSNSYWWLVRVVKDSSIGYLPAEHIETPTERLARLNKHRNIDLSATMLGDTAEKTKNPLKKAIRRRNAKTVQFAAPTYVEASDYDYSSDEDGGDDELFGGADPSQTQTQATAEVSDTEQDDSLKVQPLKVNGASKDSQESDSRGSAEESAKNSGDKERTSDEIFDRPLDQKVSRNGTLRNTDSFFKDENTETRKITLTPNLLRDDSSTSTTGSRERGPSLESLEKNGFADKVKDDKKRKEKKPGMLSGLFKRKDKKTKGASIDSIESEPEKSSEDVGRNSPQSKPVDEESAQSSPQRATSKGKLQKPQRGREESPTKTKGILKTESPEPSTIQTAQQPKEATGSKPNGPQTASTMRLVSPEPTEETAAATEERALSPDSRSRSNSIKLNPITMLKNQQNGEREPRPEKVKKAKQRVQLDDFDSDEDEKNDPFADPDSQTKSSHPVESEPVGRLSESPVHISAADAQPPGKEHAPEKEQESDSQQPPGLTGDTSSQETNSPVSTPTPDDSPSTSHPPDKPSLSVAQSAASSSPTILSPSSTNSILPPARPAPTLKEAEPSPPVSSESTSLPAWSDASLRTYLDDGSDIRDMLVVIHDTTGVTPVGPNHPIMSRLFVEETKAVSGLSGQLDGLLAGWLENRKKRKNFATAQLAR